MGRHDPERQQAIKAALAEMEPTAKEEFAEFIESCEDEDSQAIMDSNEFQDRVNRIYAENNRRDITPAMWFSSLQWPSTEDCMIRDALTERWEREVMTESVIDEINDYNHHASHDPDCRECLAIEADGDPSSNVWEPMDFLDDWSGPTIPMSAIENL